MTNRQPTPNMGEQEAAPKDDHEVERKFLVDVRNIPQKLIYHSDLIDQGYPAIGKEGSEFRVRKITDQETGAVLYASNMKNKGTLVRGEPVRDVDTAPDLFEVFWWQSGSDVLQKTRWTLARGQTIEGEPEPYEIAVDFYTGRHEGLIVTEVEFDGDTLEEKKANEAAFIPPDWFGKDITEDKRFKNQNLARTSNQMGVIVLRAAQAFPAETAA